MVRRRGVEVCVGIHALLLFHHALDVIGDTVQVWLPFRLEAELVRELLENTNDPFGGIAVILLGDILQLKPVMGKYIFDLPQSKDYHAAYHIESL